MSEVSLVKQSLVTDLTPDAPSPAAKDGETGIEEARALARRYLPNTVMFLAAVALDPKSEAPLHSRILSAKTLVDLAGALPAATPVLPPNVGNGADSSA